MQENYKKKYNPKKKKKIYKRFAEIKSNRKGWVMVELLSINKGGTITIKTIDGHIIKRKWGKRMKLSPVKRIESVGGQKPTTNIKVLSKKKMRAKKRATKKRIQKQKNKGERE